MNRTYFMQVKTKYILHIRIMADKKGFKNDIWAFEY